MTEAQLRMLEEKYWKGESSLEEENLLKNAVNHGDTDLSPEIRQLFKAYNDVNPELQLDDSFDDDFWSAVDHQSRVVKVNFGIRDFIRYAAAVAILLSLGATIWYSMVDSPQKQMVSSVQKNHFETPEEAFEEAKRALSFASSKLNKAKKPVRNIEKFHQATLSVSGMD